MNYYLQDIENEDSKYLFDLGLKYYNFDFIQNEFINKDSFYNFCKYDYYVFVDFLMKNEYIDMSNFFHQEKSFLYIAVEKENIGIVQLLLTNEKFDVNEVQILYPSKEGGSITEFYIHEKTALHLAVENENNEIIQLLLNNKNIDVNIQYKKHGSGRDIDLKTALYMAVEKGNIKIIKLLLNNENIDINIPFEYECCKGSNDLGETGWKIVEYTPFCAAVEDEKIEIVQLLLTNEKLDVNMPCKCGDQIRKGDEITDNSVGESTPFYKAVSHENIEIVRLLFENKNVDINIPFIKGKKRKTSFCEAAEKGNIEIVRLLLSNEKLDINAISKIQGNYYYGEPKSSYLLAQIMGIVPDTMEDGIEEKTAFYCAVENRKIEVIQLLLTIENIDINIPYKCHFYKDEEWIAKFEKTAFDEAVDKENIDIIKILLNSPKIDVNIPYICEGKIDDKIIAKAEKPVFNISVENESIEIIQLLLNYDKIEINIPYKCYENTTFDMKSQEEKINVIQKLLKGEKFYVTFNDKKGINQTREKTALHLATESGSTKVVKLLLNDKNININIKDENGKIPIDYAVNDEIKQLFNQ